MSGKIRFLGLVALLGLIGALAFFNTSGLAQKKPPNPPQPPADPAIAYIAGANNISKLMVMNADGSNQRVVVSERMVEYQNPDWSPDGTKLVFARNSLKGGGSGIYIVNVNGTEVRKVVNFNAGFAYTNPAEWSPVALGDGSYKIAFTDRLLLPDGTLKADSDLFLVNLDGTGLVRLTNTPWSEWSAEWSPDGKYIAVYGCCAGEYNDDVVVYQIDYTGSGFVATSLGSVVRVPGSPLQYSTYLDVDWANTQNKLVLGALTGPGTYDLWIVDVFNPLSAIQLTNTAANTEHHPSWSPDDSQILFIQGPSGGLYKVNTDDTGLKLIGYGFGQPHWRRNL